MKASFRFLAAALIVVVIIFAASAATAQITGPGGGQFPTCASGNLTINNHSNLPVDLCIKGLPCVTVPANTTINQVLLPGTPIPGVYGAALVTYTWTPNPAPPLYWISSLQTTPTFRCFDIFFDESTCTIDIFQTLGPPCVHP